MVESQKAETQAISPHSEYPTFYSLHKNMCVWGKKDRSLASTLFLFPFSFLLVSGIPINLLHMQILSHLPPTPDITSSTHLSTLIHIPIHAPIHPLICPSTHLPTHAPTQPPTHTYTATHPSMYPPTTHPAIDLSIPRTTHLLTCGLSSHPRLTLVYLASHSSVHLFIRTPSTLMRSPTHPSVHQSYTYLWRT